MMKAGKRIKVLLVDDSPVAVEVMKRILATSDEIEVVGTARHGKEALEMIPRLRPNVICTDLHMPLMNGLEFVKEVMARHPLPILVISVSVYEDNKENIFQLLEAGAIDVFPKPRGVQLGQSMKFSSELIAKIKILSGVVPFRKPKKLLIPTPTRYVAARIPRPCAESDDALPYIEPLSRPLKMIVIGASTGGPQAIEAIVKALPADFSVPVVCVQHISEGFMVSLVEWLKGRSKLNVTIVSHNERPVPGNIYFAPDDKHLKIDKSGAFVLSDTPPEGGHKPSITLTMVSFVEHYMGGVLGVLLTGMGRDGADGMLSIAQAGGVTIAQDEDSSIVFGMPEQAIKIGAAKYILDINKIGKFLVKIECIEKNL
ncbi:chemotaxis-specific protein-glutamate methyltransferase CheB [Candidatus Magnetominusculus dajiuhuensis]|uniref:chemotaxis-specific protein-glutamate methyltransferase CheB n=1 Tax=Candidatus Magnetominusculus dajiuhuensis TaxID=3137712 RepID=UPI0019FDA37B|nr:chemotaxis-specific protein-glutamate methyltransferase CheB [Nitrospirota bacterium]